MAPDQSSSTSDEEQQRPPPLLALTLPPTQSLLIPFNSDRLTADRPPPPQVVPQRVVRRLPGGAPVSVTTRTLTIKWRPPVEQIMETFNTLIGTVACFEEYLTLPSHIDICYSHLENLWNYHTLESSTFHQIYYKPTLNQPIKHHTLYRFYYQHFATIRQMMEAHTRAPTGHLMTFYLGGSDRVLNMLKAPGDYHRPFVKLYAEIASFNRETTTTLLAIPRGTLRCLCFVVP